ncbi:zinc finger protein 665 isoform X1 [Cryptotermes secundus]|uniref:zinc finger protein 665 isoform X1 n=1 Tax=Cryptotermes secundus TaxID=105785 RepID=UPI000CD7D684|nr:zinc finger protein 665 isoform X1 [Cryptotermes secundus]
MMESSVVEGEEYYNPEGSEWTQKVENGQLCRVCASANEYLIPIFDGEGLEHELGMKIQKHLPIKVTETDNLPQQMCYQCASTLIAWHDLVISCVEADKKLRELQVEGEEDDYDDKGAEVFETPSLDSEMTDDVQASTSETQNQVSKIKSPKKTAVSKEKKPNLKMVLVKGPPPGSSGQKTASKTQVAKALELAKSKDSANQDSASERCQLPPQTPFKALQHAKNEMRSMTQPRDTTDGLSDVNGMVQNESYDLEDTLLTCDYCGQISAEKTELVVHISSMHSQDLVKPVIPTENKSGIEMECKPDDCSINGCVDDSYKGYSHKIRLGKMKHLITAKQKFPCSMCGSVFNRKSDMCKHVKKHRLQDFDVTNVAIRTDYSLVTSDNSFADASVHELIPDRRLDEANLIEVERGHEDSVSKDNRKTREIITCGMNKGFSCNVCGRVLSRKYDLFRHLKTHDKKLDSCESLNINNDNGVVGNVEQMVSAMKSGLGGSGVIHGFPCNICGRILTRKFDLSRHVKTHSRKPDPFVGAVDHASPGVVSGVDIPPDSFGPGSGSVGIIQETSDGHMHEDECIMDTFFNDERKTDFPCNICGRIFTRKYNLCRHLTVHTKNQYLYPSERGLSMRPTLVSGNVNSSSSFGPQLGSSVVKNRTFDIFRGRNFSCNICSKSFIRRFDLKRHAEHHSLEDVGNLKDSNDCESLSTAKVVIEDRTLYKCKHCGKYLMTRNSYVQHLRIHTGEKPCTCHVCGKQFRTSALLNRHVRDVHEGIKEHPCDFCGRKFANKRAVLDHKRTHTGERPCVCHVCGKAFKTKASLYVHNLFHMDVFPHKCMHCNKCFRRRQHLNVHLLLHTGEKPHSCQICGKRFRLRKTLKRHVLTHTNEKPFECLVCGQLFAQERYLKNHGKTHGIRIGKKIPTLDVVLPTRST